jgi:methyl-accepting chemotaxis protein
MNAQKRYKRKLLNFSIKREMQFRMIGKICLLLFISLLLSSLIFYFFADREVTASYRTFHIKARNFLDFLLPAVISSFVISLACGALASLFFPKTIVGGVYRIEQDLKKVRDQGDLTLQIKLREGDQVSSLATEINAMLSDYQSRIDRLNQSFTVLEQYICNEIAGQGRGDVQLAQQASEQMRAELCKMNY